MALPGSSLSEAMPSCAGGNVGARRGRASGPTVQAEQLCRARAVASALGPPAALLGTHLALQQRGKAPLRLLLLLPTVRCQRPEILAETSMRRDPCRLALWV